MPTFCHLYYQVPFSETDAMGIVHHSNHARYFERGRIELLRLVELPYTEVVRQGIHIPLTEFNVSFKRPLHFDDVVLVETSVGEVSRTRLAFSYRLFSAPALRPASLAEAPFPGKPLVTGETFHCATNPAGRPVPLPPALFEKLSSLKGSL